MSEQNKALDTLLDTLKDQAKELNCLYQVEELINEAGSDLDQLFKGVIELLPSGWQYPDKCKVKITYGEAAYYSKDFVETPWVIKAAISVQLEVVGMVYLYYTEAMPLADEGPFLKKERKLINAISDRLGHCILHQKLNKMFKKETKPKPVKAEWWVILDLLRRTDPKLLMRICKKMTNYLCWNGAAGAERLMEYFNPSYKNGEVEIVEDLNRPKQRKFIQDVADSSRDIFQFASEHLSEKEITYNIQKWMNEDRSGFLVNILENPGATLAEITNAIERYHNLNPQGVELSEPREKGFRVSLIRRLLTDQPDFIKIAKQYIKVEDFFGLFRQVIFPAGSRGKLGGKSSGLFLAYQIIKTTAEKDDLLQNIKMPKTWYLTSDGILTFMNYNNMEDVMEQKYKELWQIRQEHPHIEQVFKNSPFPPEIVKGLSLALDDLGDKPIIVRSSSLLEDRFGTAFAGKYKSLFIANQGTKKARLAELTDAIAEVYASTFGPDPIKYRQEKGIVDFHEEMGIMIQEVVGQKIGSYFLPSFAGVAFSNNEFRWSSRIKHSDGLVRMVPGLGTRAVDRLSDDYPILVSPGQPGLRVNVTLDEIVRYSPKKIDVINLKTNTFETMEIAKLLKECGCEFEGINNLVSIINHDHLSQPMGLGIDFDEDDLVVTFEGLNSRTPFLKQMKSILNVLQAKMETPVDIEFAHDGKDFYLLQCRPQSYNQDNIPAEIPIDIPEEKIVFSANRFVSNGTVGDVTHIVYVDPLKYSQISDRSGLLKVGRAVGEVNQILPKGKFILMGPGRWGSRGDIKLGVNVTYSDINNSLMLIEIARKQGNYTPDLSFGTHFFQDLVESGIRYLPLYPDQSEVMFNEEFLTASKNLLPKILPKYKDLQEVVRVIDVPTATDGLILKVLMNADIGKAVGLLRTPEDLVEPGAPTLKMDFINNRHINHWRWRSNLAEKVAARLDPGRFGVQGFYLHGSVKNATATEKSDIDIIIHFRGSPSQKNDLLTWLEGWSLALAEMNFIRTGYRSPGLLDVQIITDEDIQKHTGYARKIDAAADAARSLSLGTELLQERNI